LLHISTASKGGNNGCAAPSPLKVCAGGGREALLASAEAKFPHAVFWFFFAAPCSKKNGEDHLNAIGMLFLKAGVENFFAGVHRTPLRV
jgi:hypothetical protein